ncbi:MAG: DUF3520 domain-containing protein [Planctomycetes bacterium]|nr:DUF3520 domain-containing protein [Planctomycetota bacterium]
MPDPLKYQEVSPAPGAASEDLLTLKLRYKDPEGSESKKLEFPVEDEGLGLEDAGPDFAFAAAVAEFGMLLRRSEHKGNASYDQVIELARAGKSEDPNGYRAEFLELALLARRLGG